MASTNQNPAGFSGNRPEAIDHANPPKPAAVPVNVPIQIVSAHSTGSGQAPSTGSGQALKPANAAAPAAAPQASSTSSGQAPSTGSGQAK